MSTSRRSNAGDNGESPRKLALRRALVMLSYRARSHDEIYRDLRGKGFPHDLSESVIAELSEKDLVCDPSLARDIVTSGQLSRKSRAKIYSELRRRGIDRDIAEESLAACFDADQEREAAAMAMSRLLAPCDHPPGGADIERAARKLAGRGFSAPAVAYALREAAAKGAR